MAKKKKVSDIFSDAAKGKPKTVTLPNGKVVDKTPKGKGVDKVKDLGDGKTKTIDKRGKNKKIVTVKDVNEDGDGVVKRKVVKGGETKKTTVKKFDDGYLVSKKTNKPGTKNDVVHDQSGEIARMLEEQRRAKIKSGEGLINDAFKQFNGNFYDRYRKDYLGHYNPQVDKQFTDSRRDLRYNLARARTQDSTQGQRNFGDLVAEYSKRRAEVGSNALNAVNTYKGNVDQQKNELYQQNMLAADPTKAAQSAAGRVGALQTTPAYSPLGDLFSGFIKGGTAYMAGRQKGLPAGYA